MPSFPRALATRAAWASAHWIADEHGVGRFRVVIAALPGRVVDHGDETRAAAPAVAFGLGDLLRAVAVDADQAHDDLVGLADALAACKREERDADRRKPSARDRRRRRRRAAAAGRCRACLDSCRP